MYKYLARIDRAGPEGETVEFGTQQVSRGQFGTIKRLRITFVIRLQWQLDFNQLVWYQIFL